MKLAIVGTKNILEVPFGVSVANLIIVGALHALEPELVISGGADGVDSLAENCAHLIGIPTRIFLPKNPRWEPDGYKDRNIRIAEECDELLMIGLRITKTRGSLWTSNYAEELGKKVYRCYV